MSTVMRAQTLNSSQQIRDSLSLSIRQYIAFMQSRTDVLPLFRYAPSSSASVHAIVDHLRIWTRRHLDSLPQDSYMVRICTECDAELNPRDAGLYAGTTESGVIDAIKTKKLPAKTVQYAARNREYRIKRSELDCWRERNLAMQPHRLVNLAEIARYIGVSVSRAWAYCQPGLRYPLPVIIRSPLQAERRDIDEWMICLSRTSYGMDYGDHAPFHDLLRDAGGMDINDVACYFLQPIEKRRLSPSLPL